MRFLLDTNAVSEYRKSTSADAGFKAWAQTQSITDLAISTLTLMELEIGISLLIHRNDHAQAGQLRAWVDGAILAMFADRILPVDDAVARRCAPLHVPDPKSSIDALIAATALVHGLTVVTRNLADFRKIDVPLLSPWLSP